MTLEFVPNDDRVSPPEQAAFAMTMLASTAAGDAYTFAELKGMAAKAGFRSSEMHRLADGAADRGGVDEIDRIGGAGQHGHRPRLRRGDHARSSLMPRCWDLPADGT